MVGAWGHWRKVKITVVITSETFRGSSLAGTALGSRQAPGHCSSSLATFQRLSTLEGKLRVYSGEKNVSWPLSGNGKELCELLPRVVFFAGDVVRCSGQAGRSRACPQEPLCGVAVGQRPASKLFVITTNTLPGKTLCQGSEQRVIFFFFFGDCLTLWTFHLYCELFSETAQLNSSQVLMGLHMEQSAGPKNITAARDVEVVGSLNSWCLAVQWMPTV